MKIMPVEDGWTCDPHHKKFVLGCVFGIVIVLVECFVLITGFGL